MSGKKLFARGKDRENQGEEGDKQDNIRTIQVQFKAKNKDKFKTCHDIEFDHFPSREEVAEELGGGIWRVYGRGSKGEIIKQRKYSITDREIVYPVEKYKIKIKKDQRGKWYNTDLEYAHKPTEEEIETDIGGGGIVKIYGVDGDGKMVTQEPAQIDAEPPEWLIESEDEVQKSLKEKLAERRKDEDEKLLKSLEGKDIDDEDEQGTGEVAKAVKNLNQTIENLALDQLKQNINKLTQSVSGGKDGSTEPRELSFSDVMFKQPQMKKLDAISSVVQELAKEDPHKAAELLDKIPDASGAFVNLLTAAGEALSAGSKALSAQADAKMREVGTQSESGKTPEKKKEKEKPREVKQKPKEKEEKEAEEEEEKKEPEEGTEEHTEPEETQEPEPVGFEVEKRESGFDITLDVDEEEVGAEE